MELLTYCQSVIEPFLTATQQGFNGYVLGLSGGIDSALVAALAKAAVGKDKLLCLVLPIDSSPEDLLDADAVAHKLDLHLQTIDLSPSYHHLLATLEVAAIASGKPLDQLAKMNLKVRLRMVTLYAFAQARHALVLGTDNADEYYTGYFTKYGDGAVDLLPIVHLTKGEVVEAAKLYHIPCQVIEKIPTAGLFAGQTDEGEMGLSYHDLDQYLLGHPVAKAVGERIEHLHRISEHKRQPLPRPARFER